MSSKLINKYTCGLTLLAGAGLMWGAVTGPARGAVPGKQGLPWAFAGVGLQPQAPPFVPGQAVVRLASGADAQALAAALGIHVKQQLQFAPNTYLLDGIAGDVNDAVNLLNRTPGVLRANVNLIYHGAALPTQTPNDPLQTQQWALQMLNAQTLWNITVGERLVDGPARNVLVGVIDSGFETAHPDLADNLAPGAFDFVRNAPYDESLIPNTAFATHGSNVAGAVAAVTNNSTGIASLPWEGVKVLACHAGDNFNIPGNPQSEPIVTSAAAVDAIYYCIQQQADVINMSFGVQGTTVPTSGAPYTPDPLVQQAVHDAYQKGIVLVGSSGNYRQLLSGTTSQQSPPVQFPANQPEVIAVGAVGASGELAYYSNGGPELQFVAPGGNISTFNSFDPSRLVVTTDSLNSIFSDFEGLPAGYVYTQGTSIAAGYASGAIATLITQGARDATLSPTEQVERIRMILRKTAQNQFGARSNDFGYGVIDPAAALQEFSPTIDVSSPTPGSTTASFAESLNAVITRPQLAPVVGGAPGDYVRTAATLNPGDFTVLRNGADITDQVTSDPQSGAVHFTPDVQTHYSVGVNDLDITANDANVPGLTRSLSGPAAGHVPARYFRFRVTPRVEQAGLKLLSVPYQLLHDSTDPDHSPDNLVFLFGGNLVRLARWLPDQKRYAIYDINGSPQDPEAALTTSSAGVAHPPVGIGFFARVINQTQVQLLGNQETAAVYEIPLQSGFNLIGDPYAFSVPWNAVSVRYGNEIISISEAAQRKLISNVLWSYDGGTYTFQALPNGSLNPWEGNWVQSFANLSLLVPRINSTPGQVAQTPARSRAGWKLALKATTNEQRAGEVFVGETPVSAGNGFDRLELPPAVQKGSEFRIRPAHARPGTRLAQDIRSAARAAQRWDLEVETSKPGESVKVTWDSLPSGVRGSIQVEGAHPRPLSSVGEVRFQAERPGIHHLTLIAAAAPVAPAR